MITDFVKEKVFWTPRMNLRLVKYIQKKLGIWNPNHPKYNCIEYRDKTYSQFATKYGYEFSGNAVKERWTNIRTTFTNYLRKLKKSRVNGEEYQINWQLWEPCQFLLSVNKRLKVDKKSSNKEDWKDNMSTYSNPNDDDNLCTNIAENLLTVFKGVQNDVFSLNNSLHSHIGQAISEKLSQMDSYDAARLSTKIMEILLLYDANNPLNPNNLKENH